MSQTYATIEITEVVVKVQSDIGVLTFIQDVEYEFVGGGTAFNSL